MKRRDFLKILGAAPAVAAIPALANTGKTTYTPIEGMDTFGMGVKSTIRVELKGDEFSKEQVKQLIDGINEELEQTDI